MEFRWPRPWLMNPLGLHLHLSHLEFQRDQPAVKLRRQHLLIADLLVEARIFALCFVRQNLKP